MAALDLKPNDAGGLDWMGIPAWAALLPGTERPFMGDGLASQEITSKASEIKPSTRISIWYVDTSSP